MLDILNPLKPGPPVMPIVLIGNVVVGQIDIPIGEPDYLESYLKALTEDGVEVHGLGLLRLHSDGSHPVYISPPSLLHEEGLKEHKRIGVLSIMGYGDWRTNFPQPETDWLLRACKWPYDDLAELCLEYRTGLLSSSQSIIEVIAFEPVQVWEMSSMTGTSATIGIWMPPSLSKNGAQLGVRVMSNGVVALRKAFFGNDLTWELIEQFSVGKVDLVVPLGATIQLIASYNGHAHHVGWRMDLSVLPNPRNVPISMVDPDGEIMRSYLFPSSPKNHAAKDFETAVCWLFWSMGFASISLGLTTRTRDSIDIVVASPRGDIAIVECTLRLLKSESKLQNLVARASDFKTRLSSSNHSHLRVLPVIVSALSRQELLADIPDAEKMGVVVLTKENLENALKESFHVQNANYVFERGYQTMTDRRKIHQWFAPRKQNHGV